MGAILAVRRRGNSDQTIAILRRMAAVSPHRGELESLRLGSLALGVQSLGWDASLARHGDLVVAVHGYVRLPGASVDDGCSAADVVAEMWIEEGSTGLARLDGEFAVVVGHVGAGDILAACSVGGTRPLFFSSRSDELAVATEVRQVRSAIEAEPDLDDLSLVKMLLHRPVEEGQTLDRQVSRIYPSRIYRFGDSQSGQEPSREAYWKPPRPAEGTGIWDFEESAHRLQTVLKQVVDDSTPAEPWAMSLSGGRDSSAIWALAERSKGKPVSLEFPGLGTDERSLIEQTVKHVGGPDPLWVEAASEDPIERSQDLLPWMDAPLFPTTYLSDLVARAAHGEGRHVLIKGNGGDEWLGGVPLLYLREEFASGRWWPGIAAFLRFELPDSASRARFIWSRGLRPAAGGVLRDLGLRRAQPPVWLTEGAWDIVSRDSAPSWLDSEKGPVRSFLARTLHLRRTSFELWAMEQVAARHRVEVRLPFMHRRLIDFAFEVPPQHVVAGCREKHLLRIALAGLYAPCIERRRSRTYFSEPFTSRAGDLESLFRGHEWVLLDSDFIDRRGVERLSRKSSEESSLRQLLGLYMADRYVATLLQQLRVSKKADTETEKSPFGEAPSMDPVRK